MMRSFAFTSLIAVPAIIMPAAAYAQTATTGTPTREEVQRLPTAPLPPQGTRVTVEGEVERAPCPLADPQYKDITVALTSVTFNGLGAIPRTMLDDAYADRIGKTVPIADVCEIRDRAATKLRQAGYLAAVQVPPQRIENGNVVFDVLVAKLVGFQVRGQAGNSEGLIERYLEKIRDQPVFNIVTAERYLLLARDIPGFDVRMTLRPAGTVPGEVIGEVQVVHRPIDLSVNVQDYGSREVGRFGGIAQLHINGLLGLGDQTTLGFFTTSDFKEQQVAQASEEIRVGGEGLTLGADFNYAWTRPTIGGGIFLRSHTLIATARARYPLIRRQAQNLFATAGFDYIDQSSTFNGLPLSEDHLRVPFVRLDYDRIDPTSIADIRGYSISEPRWRFGGNLEVRQGVDLFDASIACGPTGAACTAGGRIPPSRLTADPTAFLVRGTIGAEFRPIPIVTLSALARAQYSPDTLLSYEQFSAGTYTIGRGFDPGTLIGDSGVGVRGEVTVGSLVPRSRKDLAIQAYAFIDAAWVWNHSRLAGVADPQKLQSAGAGGRAAFGDRFQLDVGFATPFRAAGLQTVRGDTRVLMSLTVKLLPWTR